MFAEPDNCTDALVKELFIKLTIYIKQMLVMKWKKNKYGAILLIVWQYWSFNHVYFLCAFSPSNDFVWSCFLHFLDSFTIEMWQITVFHQINTKPCFLCVSFAVFQ